MNLDKIETQEEKEAFDGMANSSEVPNSSEWCSEGLPPVGVECEKIFDGRSQIVTPLYYDDHKYGMVMFYCKGIGNSAASDYDWCLVENCVFRKLETPEQKAERERDENGKAMWQDFGYLNPKTPTWESLKPEYAECWRNFAEKTGYRKQND